MQAHHRAINSPCTAPAVIDRAWLEARFGTFDAPGWSKPIISRSGEQIFSRTRAPTCLCWGGAQEVVAELGNHRAVITGYPCLEGSTSAIAAISDGHDLALVDGRYLVDGWITHVESISDFTVLDLMDPIDLAEARRLHEPFHLWTVPPSLTADDDRVTVEIIHRAIREATSLSRNDAMAARIYVKTQKWMSRRNTGRP